MCVLINGIIARMHTEPEAKEIQVEATAKRDWLTVKDAARELDVPLSRAYELIHTGHLPAVRLGERTLRVFRPELEKFLLEECRVVDS